MYTDQSRVEDFLQRELADQEASNLDDLIAAVSMQIDDYTGHTWLPVGGVDDSDELEAEERVFDGTGSKEIFVDDFIGLEKVEILDYAGDAFLTVEDDTQWQTFPSNKNPKSSVRLRFNHFPEGIGNVQITAIWGTGSVPSDVIITCTELVAKYLMRTAEVGPFKRESIEGYSRELITDSDFAMDTMKVLTRLDRYKRILL